MRKVKELRHAQIEPKNHFKMYKTGRNWLFAGITVFTMGAGIIGAQSVVHAATDNEGMDASTTTTTVSTNDDRSVALSDIASSDGDETSKIAAASQCTGLANKGATSASSAVVSDEVIDSESGTDVGATEADGQNLETKSAAATVTPENLTMSNVSNRGGAETTTTTQAIQLTSTATSVGYGTNTGLTLTVQATITAHAGQTVTLTVPTNLVTLGWKNVEVLPASLGTTTFIANADGTYTVTDKFISSGIAVQNIILDVYNNTSLNNSIIITTDQLSTSGQVTSTSDGETGNSLTISQKINPTVTISSPVRVQPSADDYSEIVPNTSYVYAFSLVDSNGLNNDVGSSQVLKALNSGGTVITIPVPTGFVLDSAATNALNTFGDKTTIT